MPVVPPKLRSNALYARAGLVGYSGPHYSSFGMKHHFGYTETGFRACVMEDGPITLTPSPDWSDDARLGGLRRG